MAIKMIILITVATITCNSFSMEKQNKEPLQLLVEQLHRRSIYYAEQNDGFHELHNVLEKHVVENHTIINSAQQYEMLKTCIDFCDQKWLHLCLHHYNFNPNRYHKNISVLHYAIQQKNYPALCDLTNANPDLVPSHELGATFGGKSISETPLDFAVRLRDASEDNYDDLMRYKECVRIMIQAIRTKYNDIIFNKKHCGLTKHLINAGRPCLRCIVELSEKLRWHGVSYTPYSAISDYSSTATEADSNSLPDSCEQ